MEMNGNCYGMKCGGKESKWTIVKNKMERQKNATKMDENVIKM